MWFTEEGANRIGMINSTNHGIHEYLIDSSGHDEPEGITVGPDSNLWFTLAGINKIGAMNPNTGAMVGEYNVPTANAGLSQIVSDPANGTIWFTEAGANQVGSINPTTQAVAEFATPTAGSSPGSIAVAKGGNIWFIESNASRVAELYTNNPITISEYVVTGLNPLPPTIVREEALPIWKHNKKGKRVGKPVSVSLELDYSTAMDPASAGSFTNYKVTVKTIQRGKRSIVPCTRPSPSRRTMFHPGTPSS